MFNFTWPDFEFVVYCVKVYIYAVIYVAIFGSIFHDLFCPDCGVVPSFLRSSIMGHQAGSSEEDCEDGSESVVVDMASAAGDAIC
ncbi:hypothetical protein NM688_g4692 [Phlebia brevispora]|uniref:Uncharacterized protein n=1 Tax=Phlebia brevispora TaxID=194682 RepID=A0ACC1T2D4_9APHY|nr:hypothetical protein NM688_g4692 [Phlebia brevispora]